MGLTAAFSPMVRKQFGQRIVGGDEATKGDFPFIVDLKAFGGHYCGGSIVNSEWILTAAHCATLGPLSYTVVAGDHDIGSNEGTEQTREVTQVILHPDYNDGTFDNDAAMMKVSQPFDFSGQWVKPAIFAMGSEAIFEGNATVSGWGALTEGGSSPDVLNKVVVPIVSRQVCNEAYNPNGYDITESMICAGVAGKDSCQGDSGGPMLCQRPSGAWVHCGIVSWGIGCARPGYPGVYARTSSFEDFIRETVGVPPCDGHVCVDGTCIPSDWVCDHWPDCSDRGDEVDCHFTTNAARAFPSLALAKKFH
jgi:trypsin